MAKNDVMTTSNINASTMKTNLNVKNSDKATIEALNKQKKLPIMIPIDPNTSEDFVVVVNGTIYQIKRGVLVEVPETVFNIAQESMIKTAQISQEIKITEQ